MLIKSADDKEASIKTLEAIKAIPGLPAHKRALVEQEIRTTLAGVRGEADTAYEIEFHLGKSQNTMVLHDLRFELADGRSAQIDHLLIHRTGRMWVLESKRVAKGVKITEEGEFLRWNGRTYDGMASPLEQNRRHVEVLRAVLQHVKCSFAVGVIHSYVVVSSKARIDRPRKGKFDSSLVVKADLFLQNFDRDLDKLGFFDVVTAIFASGGHKELAQELVTLHRPIEIDYAARFDISREAIARQLNAASAASGLTEPKSPGTPEPQPVVARTTPAPVFNEEPGLDEYDPDWLEHLGLTGPTATAKLPDPATSESARSGGAGAVPARASATERDSAVAGASGEDRSQPGPEHQCRHCHSSALAVTYGQYGYYFKCQDCEGNTPIKISCGRDGHKERIRKAGERFYRECAECKSSRLFYVNGSRQESK